MKWLIVWLICCWITGCSSKHNIAGEAVIPKQEMADILWDIMAVDEFATAYIARDSLKNLKIERINLYRKVFSLHKVTEQAFSSSFTYYSAHPDMIKLLYDSLAVRGERERQRMYLPDSAKSK